MRRFYDRFVKEIAPMKRTALCLMLTLAAWSASAASMHYTAPHTGITLAAPPVTFVNPATNNLSTCTAASNTVAVGYDVFSAGFRILCADAGRIGFWTTTTLGALSGQQSDSAQRYLCPSGTALAGVQFVEGIISPFPLCGELLPDFTTGQVHRTVLFTPEESVVEKEATKNTVPPPGVVSCGVGGYVQSLIANRTATGAVSGFGVSCNSIETNPANVEDVNVDLAVKTAMQKSVLGRNATENFRVDVFNLGTLGVPASNVIVELRFDGAAWDIQQFANALCTDIMAHKGVVDMVVVGKRCTMPVSSVPGRGGVVSMNFQLQPQGPDTLRPASTTPHSIFSVKAALVNENLQGADANANNDVAAFPVILH